MQRFSSEIRSIKAHKASPWSCPAEQDKYGRILVGNHEIGMFFFLYLQILDNLDTYIMNIN